MTESEKEIALRAKQALDAADVQYKVLAQAVRRSGPTVTDYLNGTIRIPVTVLLEVSRLTGRSLDWLITGENRDEAQQKPKRTGWADREGREAPRIGEGDACYLKGTVHLSNTELRLLAAFRDIDAGQQSSIIGIAEAFRVSNESRENVGGGSVSAVQKSA